MMATEVGRFNADFLFYRKGKLIEVEIKTSKADLNADFKKKKHLIYKSGKAHWTPNQFYFAVPSDMVEYALTKSLDYGYGVMEIKPVAQGRSAFVVGSSGEVSKTPSADDVRIVKRANDIHKRSVHKKVIIDMAQRLMSEVANLRIHKARKQ